MEGAGGPRRFGIVRVGGIGGIKASAYARDDVVVVDDAALGAVLRSANEMQMRMRTTTLLLLIPSLLYPQSPLFLFVSVVSPSSLRLLLWRPGWHENDRKQTLETSDS